MDNINTNQQVPQAPAPLTQQGETVKSGGKGMMLLGGLPLLVVLGAMVFYIMTPKTPPIATPSIQTAITPPAQQVVKKTPVSENQIDTVDTADPALDLQDIGKDISNL